MQIVIKIKPLIVTILLFLLWKFVYLNAILLRFSKSPTFVTTYESIYFLFLLGVSFLMRHKIVEVKAFRLAVFSVLLGYIASLGCIFLTWVVMADKVSELAWITVSFGIMDTLLYYLVIPLPALGWFLTPLAFFMLKIGSSKTSGPAWEE